MSELSEAMLSKLSTPERQKLNHQLRQAQVKKYLTFIKSERENNKGSIKRQRKPNKKKTCVKFGDNLLLQDAVQNFDDREVLRLINKGSDVNYSTGNNTSLLHKSVSEDNLTTAELLLAHGADANALDDDGWSPLHQACSCELPEMAQLILNNGADPTALDVDGFFPSDLAPDGSETQQVVLKHMEKIGITADQKKELQLNTPRQMFSDVQLLLTTGSVLNAPSDLGITLLHIACANGFKKVVRLLLKKYVNVDAQENMGWTSLHVAARYNQMDILKLLLKAGADPNLVDVEGNKASAVTNSTDIQALLMKAERKSGAKLRDSEIGPLEGDDGIYDQKDGPGKDETGVGGLVRINSKTVKTKHTTLAREDGLSEARTRLEFLEGGIGSKPAAKQGGSGSKPDTKSFNEEEDVYEEIYITKIWRGSDNKLGILPEVTKTDNLTELAEITESIVLKEIQQRFSKSQIYTFIGDVLIAVNPFQEMSCYSKSISAKYHKEREQLPPHVYAVAERAHQCLMRDRAAQCCVISGESGAGKTETCKFLVQHLSRIAGSDESSLNSKINQGNAVLEAFGNAKTVINSNSSRYAKYIELHFNDLGKIMGAKLTEYLLEKSRVVFQNEGECNYHIFYWMFSGLTPEESHFLKLQSITAHRYMRHKGIDPDSLVNSENREKFLELKECLKFIGFTQDDMENILLMLSTVLHLGDITFTTGGMNDMAVITNSGQVQLVSELLKVSAEELGSSFVCDYTVTRGEQIRKERTLQQARDCRDALAKAIYSRMFSWIVNGINQMIQSIVPREDPLLVGILDIFGFENFAKNSFEQVCINLANEQMQNYTNEHIFYKEQQDCLQEGVPLVDFDYKNNQSVLDTFFERHTGILAILDEESSFPKATDRSLATKLHQGPGKKYRDVYKSPKDMGAVFTVVHYAGAVVYSLLGFLDKNRDTLPNAVTYTLKTSESLLIKDLFQSRVTRTGSLAPSARQQRSRRVTTNKSPFEFFKKMKGGKTDKKPKGAMMSVERKGPATMAYHFKNSLNDLMAKIHSAKPQIIRCIRPNTTKTAMLFVPEYALAQLRYTGIAETIKIKKFGYSMRIKFHDFLLRYHTLAVCLLEQHSMIPDLDKCKHILQWCQLSEAKDKYKIGKSRLFMCERHCTRLEEGEVTLIGRVTLAQAVVRGFLARRNFKTRKIQIQQKQEMEVSTFCHQMALHQDQLLAWLQVTNTEDDKRLQQKLKSDEVQEICKSLDALDDLLDVYDDYVPEVEQEDVFTDKDLDDYDFVYPRPEQAEGDNEDDMNGHVQYRGLPPPPHGDFICDSGNPPPCPRDLYSQSQIYDTIPANQGEYGSQRRTVPAPAPPRRSPSTRLSTGSRTSSSSSGIYDDTALYMDDGHHSPQHQPQPPHPPINIPPLQMSPRLQKKMVASPLVSPRSPSHQNPNKPFSYIVNLPGSPKTHRRSSDGKYYDVPDVSPPGDPTYEPIGQPHPYSLVEKHKATSSGQYGAPASPGHQSPSVYSQGHPATPASPGHQSQGYYGQSQGHPASNGGQYGAPASPGHQGQGYYGQGQGHTHTPQGQHHGQLPAMQQPQYSPSHRTASPPPLPKVGPGSAPHSPSLQRQSSLTRKNEKVSSPVMPRKSADPRVVTPDPGAMSESQRSGLGPPSFPAPPPPLPVAARFVAATLENNRPPSPPLPPPPPEMISDSSPHNTPHKVPPPVVPTTVPKVANPPPPPPPPISKIPGRPQISSFEIGKKQSKGDDSHDQGNKKQHTMPLPGQAAVIRPKQQKQQQLQSKNLVEELSKVTLRTVQQTSVQQPEPQPVLEEPRVKPSPPKPPEKTNPPSGKEAEPAAVFLPKLKSTGAKPWDKDVPTGQNVPHPQMEDDDLPPPPPPPMDDDFLPPPPPPPGITPNMELYQTGGQQRYKKDSSPDPERKPDSGIGSNSSLSSMEIDLDDIDFSQIPGYTPINSSVPNWKKDMVEKKNREKLDEYLNEIRRRKAEEEKWKNVPEWKRKLLVEKDKLKREEDEMKTTAALREQEERRRKAKEKKKVRILSDAEILERTNAKISPEPPITPVKEVRPIVASPEKEVKVVRPSSNIISPDPPPPPPPVTPQKEDEQRRKEERKQQIEEEKIDEEELAALPAWKREIMAKRGGALRNWGDEREEENEAPQEQ
ncbi:unconventional myosin-XVI-like isoform X4 [Mizuhopecten yessoensis]|uniref:unconventional myosin-XVI-like isoform X4 n=1 Tax=Mizuhopecten yessoensis TaxID=6573 RepID=UPI000B459B25|nr:unconventional myosin-XVI-like isoform X4 [Mizuhopecten yessoensis]